LPGGGHGNYAGPGHGNYSGPGRVPDVRQELRESDGDPGQDDRGAGANSHPDVADQDRPGADAYHRVTDPDHRQPDADAYDRVTDADTDHRQPDGYRDGRGDRRGDARVVTRDLGACSHRLTLLPRTRGCGTMAHPAGREAHRSIARG
jgi:hypothetical protein